MLMQVDVLATAPKQCHCLGEGAPCAILLRRRVYVVVLPSYQL